MFELEDAAFVERTEWDERNSEVFAQRSGVDAEALGFGTIYFVEGDDDGVAEIDDLKEKLKVAFDLRGIEDAEDEIGWGFAFLITKEEIAGDFFVRGIWAERIATGEIDEFELVSVRGKKLAGFSGDGCPCVIADLLVLPGEGVEKGGFSGIGISDQGDMGLDGGRTHRRKSR